jgi:hypothetical protein
MLFKILGSANRDRREHSRVDILGLEGEPLKDV